MKAEEHPLSQKPLIERITPESWSAYIAEEGDTCRSKTVIVDVSGENPKTILAIANRVPELLAIELAYTSAIDELSNERREGKRIFGENRELQASLLKAEQERDRFENYFNQSLKRIQELEETISNQEASGDLALGALMNATSEFLELKSRFEAILKENQKIKLDSMEESRRLIDENQALRDKIFNMQHPF